MTRCPARRSLTPLPTVSTTPIAVCPRITGEDLRRIARHPIQSVEQNGAAVVRTMSCRSPGARSSTSRTPKGDANAVSTAARARMSVGAVVAVDEAGHVPAPVAEVGVLARGGLVARRRGGPPAVFDQVRRG